MRKFFIALFYTVFFRVLFNFMLTYVKIYLPNPLTKGTLYYYDTLLF